MARDTQRQRVYNAEHSIRKDPIGTGSMDEVTAFTAQVVGSSWWRKRSTTRVVQVKDGRGRVNACAYGNTIKLPRWARSKMVVLHELAHILQSGDAPHGREFAAAMIALVDRFGDPGDGELLRAAFAEKRVRWRGGTPPIIRTKLPESFCAGCGRGFPKPPPWRLAASLGTSRFCTKRCAQQWFAARLKRVDYAAAIRG
jgi:hypothetical protein